jgi:hypothetical protein
MLGIPVIRFEGLEHPLSPSDDSGRVKGSIIRLRRSLTRRCRVSCVPRAGFDGNAFVMRHGRKHRRHFRQEGESFLSRKSQALSPCDRDEDENALGIVYTRHASSVHSDGGDNAQW